MPIKVPDNLPALEILAQEGVDLIAENIAQQHINTRKKYVKIV